VRIISEEHRRLLQEDLLSTKYEGLTRFMVANRQTGSTTALVKAAVESDGYLIVGSTAVARNIAKQHPEINKQRILTIQKVRSGKWEFDPRPVFIDATAVWGTK